MTLKTPSFWFRPTGSNAPLLECFLSPLAGVYSFFFSLNQISHKARTAALPVLCIGNIVAGGTGKTPTSIAFMNSLVNQGVVKNPFFLIRGYGGSETGPTLVDLDVHNAWDVGDEALILAKHAPTIVGGDRVLSAELASKHGADIAIMDDGLQNPNVHKDLKIVVINGEMGFGNKKLMPAGPLRQKLEDGLANADGFILIGADERNIASDLPASKPVFKASLQSCPSFKPDTTQAYLAFAGLGYPNKFFNFLKNSLNMNIQDCVTFCDHHPYDKNDLKALYEKAQNLHARLITTEKDFLRLPVVDGIDVDIVPIEMVWDDEDALIKMVKSRLN